jgi:hypothetical protein
MASDPPEPEGHDTVEPEAHELPDEVEYAAPPAP